MRLKWEDGLCSLRKTHMPTKSSVAALLVRTRSDIHTSALAFVMSCSTVPMEESQKT